MPRSAEEILARADELARRFEDYEPAPGDVRDAGALRGVAGAFARLAASQRDLVAAVHARVASQSADFLLRPLRLVAEIAPCSSTTGNP